MAAKGVYRAKQEFFNNIGRKGKWASSAHVRERISLDLLAEIRQQMLVASRNPTVTLDIARPGPVARIMG